MKAFRISGIAICSMLIMAACGQKKTESTAAVQAEPAAKPLVTLAKVVEELPLLPHVSARSTWRWVTTLRKDRSWLRWMRPL